MPPNNNELARYVGEIKGQLDGIQTMIAAHNESVNRRIDDLHRAVTQRLDEHREEIAAATSTAHEALKQAKAAHAAVDALKVQVGKRSAVSGGGAAALVAGGIELIKAALT
jgi:chromosome condensin MukBEF ATPase and DNA-binding subunit MukB